MTRGSRKPPGYWPSWSAALLFFAGFYALLVPLPRYLVAVGLPDWQVSMILGAFGVASLLGRPAAGWLVDRWGSRRVMHLGTLFFLLGALLVPLTIAPALLFVLRVLQAAGYVCFTTAATALVAALVPVGERAGAMAVFGIAANIAIVMTPAGMSAALGWLPLAGAFPLAAGLALIASLLVLRVKPGVLGEDFGRQGGSLLGLVRALRYLILEAVLFGVGFGAFFQFLPLLSDRRELGPAGVIYTIYGGGIILTRLLTGRLLDGSWRKWLLPAAFLVLGLGLTAFAFAASRLMLAAAALLTALASGIVHPSLLAIHVNEAPAAQRGLATAAFYLGFDLGIGGGAWLLAPALERLGLTGFFLLAALVAVLGALLAPVGLRRLGSEVSP